LRYIITNTNASTLNDIYVGLYLDWDILPSFSSNAGGYDVGTEVAWMAYKSGTTYSDFRGTSVLEGNIAGALTSSVTLINYPQGLTEREKDSVLGIGFGTAATYAGVQQDLLQVVSVGPVNLTAGASDTVSFALLAGNDLTAIDNAAFFAQTVYDSLINSCCLNLAGDLNGDGTDGNVLDLTFAVNRVFRFGPMPVCVREGDANGDGASTNVLDLTHLVNRIFRFGPPPIPCPGF
jgi:hypothetical protein